MKQNIDSFMEQMLRFFPSKIKEYSDMCYEMQQDFSERLDTIIIEDIFMPEIISLIKKNTEIELLKELFEYFEEVSNEGDEELINIFSVTSLEILGNDKEILRKAYIYMGPKTKRLQFEADQDLGR